jgi:hypothetical protein
MSYNASAVKIYNATDSLVRFENKNILPICITRSCKFKRHRIGSCSTSETQGAWQKFCVYEIAGLPDAICAYQISQF